VFDGNGRLMRRLMVTAALAASLALAACGDDEEGPAGEPAQAATSGAAALHEKAKEEGTVVWHVGFDSEEAEPLVEAFEETYPGVEVEVVSISEPALPAKLTSESATGKVSIDVAMGRTDTLRPLLERDVLVKEDWASLADIDPANIMLDGRLVKVYDFVIGWFYNKDKVPEAEVPKVMEDLLDPKWGGRKMLIQANGDVSLAGRVMTKEWTKYQVRDFLEKMKQQDVIAEARGTPIVSKVGTGQYPLGVAPITVVPGAIEDGAPLALLPFGPVVSLPNGVFEVKNAAHPNAAKLLISWLGSEDAKPVWQSLGRGGATKCEDSELAQMLCDAGIEVVEADTLELAHDVEEVAAIGREVLGVSE
jgi:iron(III) transport system substrate-binding protein